MIYTIGHSNHPFERFLDLLSGAGVTAIADVRSAPHSRWAGQFNKHALSAALAENGIAYVFLGKELGGRPKDPALLKGSKPDYAALARSETFRSGIERVLTGSQTHRIALMCAEKDPIDCHRFHLIARHLAERGIPVAHILATGNIEEQAQTERRFAARSGTGDLFA